MKRQVRTGVFETNSSSTHAIAISKESDPKLRFPEKVTFRFADFGWEERTLDSMQDKANYLYTCLYYVLYDDIKKWENYLKFIYQTLKANDVACEFEGNIELYVSTWNEPHASFSIDGYVDHGDAAEEFVDAVCTNEQLLLRYLFSGHSIIKTGNDNDDTDISFHLDYPYAEFYKGN